MPVPTVPIPPVFAGRGPLAERRKTVAAMPWSSFGRGLRGYQTPLVTGLCSGVVRHDCRPLSMSEAVH